jgi:hypothetical protein
VQNVTEKCRGYLGIAHCDKGAEEKPLLYAVFSKGSKYF